MLKPSKFKLRTCIGFAMVPAQFWIETAIEIRRGHAYETRFWGILYETRTIRTYKGILSVILPTSILSRLQK